MYGSRIVDGSLAGCLMLHSIKAIGFWVGGTAAGPSRRFSSGKKVTALHRLPLHIVCSLPPDTQRAAILFEERTEWSAGTPKMQHRARDTPRFRLIRLVILDI
jgi:hypothetical protein